MTWASRAVDVEVRARRRAQRRRDGVAPAEPDTGVQGQGVWVAGHPQASMTYRSNGSDGVHNQSRCGKPQAPVAVGREHEGHRLHPDR
jgi:hypothetical protein